FVFYLYRALRDLLSFPTRRSSDLIVEEKDHDIDGIRLMKDYYLMNSGEVSMVMQQLERTMGRTITRDDVEIETYLLHVAGQSVSAAEYSASLASWDTAAE